MTDLLLDTGALQRLVHGNPMTDAASNFLFNGGNTVIIISTVKAELQKSAERSNI